MADVLSKQYNKTVKLAVNPLNSNIATVTLQVDVSGPQTINLTSISEAVSGQTSLNTPNTIVLRDASGNFSAGTITATLNGAANSAASVTGTVGIANGGTGQTSQQAALNALSGTQTSGTYLRSNGTNVSLTAIQAADVPTLNQNTTGTAAGLSATLAIGSGGTGQTTQQAAINALTGTQSSGKYLRSDGTNATLASIQAADVPTLNQNTTGTASNVTGTVAIGNGGTGQTSSNAALNALVPSQTGNSGKFLKTDGTNTSWATPSASGNTAPTVQKFTSGSGTYTTPTSPSTPLYIRVRMVGGGGGGSSSGTGNSGVAGSNGSDTTFGSHTAGKGFGGAAPSGGGATGGAGGTATIGSGGSGLGISGGQGGSGQYNGSSAGLPYLTGGLGAASPFGGGGSSLTYGAGQNAPSNSGAGGGGAGTGNGSSAPSDCESGAGGGAGAYLDIIISSPVSTYSYAVGAGGSGGTAGTSGAAGGTGGSGIIIVEEFYQ